MVPRRSLLLLQSGLIAGAFTIGGNQQPQHIIAASIGTSSTKTRLYFADTTIVDSGTTTNNNPVAVGIDDLLLGSTTEHCINYDIVKVDLDKGRDYPIYIGTGYSNPEASQILQSHVHGKKILIVTNDNIAPLFLDQYQALFSEKTVETLIVPDGEEYKNMDVLNTILSKCLECKLDRKSTLIALGGGVIGDTVGFAAAIYQRGIAFIQIPTTVMAMVDSSVGGKTGVNHPLGKNMIGAFHQPNCVFIDTDNLQSLPDRELYSGVSEIIKYGLIRDAEFFSWLESNVQRIVTDRNPEALRYAITRSCQNKAAVVKLDEKEAGVRAKLNLGHTFGHAIENGSGYGTFLHGEAVAIGTAMATTMSTKLGWIDDTTVRRIYNILNAANLPVALPKDSIMTRNLFLELMSVDKKVADGQLRLILLKGALGNCVFTGDFEQQALLETIDEFVADCQGQTAADH